MSEYFLKANFSANWDDARDLVRFNKFLKVVHFHDETMDELLLTFELNRQKEEDTIEISFKIRDLFHILAELSIEVGDDE